MPARRWPGHAAEIVEVAGLAGAERDRGAGALAGDARRLRVLVGKHDVVLGAFAVDQRELHDLAFGGGQDRIDLAVDRAADAEIDHAAFGDAGAQRVTRIREIESMPAAGARLGGAVAGGAAGVAGADGRPRRAPLLGCWPADEIRDDVLAVVVSLQAGERHLVAGHDLLRDRPDTRRASCASQVMFACFIAGE